MAKHLSKRDIDAIVKSIDEWDDGKLTWAEVCKACRDLTGKSPTRQTLSSHEAIRLAYVSKKNRSRQRKSTGPAPSSLAAASERIRKLEAKIARVEAQNDVLLERFVVWQYNAYKHGMREHQLNEPLPAIDRVRG